MSRARFCAPRVPALNTTMYCPGTTSPLPGGAACAAPASAAAVMSVAAVPTTVARKILLGMLSPVPRWPPGVAGSSYRATLVPGLSIERGRSQLRGRRATHLSGAAHDLAVVQAVGAVGAD